MSTRKNLLLEKLKYHVTGAIERGEKQAIVAVVEPKQDRVIKRKVKGC